MRKEDKSFMWWETHTIISRWVAYMNDKFTKWCGKNDVAIIFQYSSKWQQIACSYKLISCEQ
jgi:hypothetical protein